LRLEEGFRHLEAVVEFRVLGPVELDGDHGPVAVGAAKQRELLALLLLSPNQSVSRDWLIDQLWDGRPPPAARSTLQAYVYRLRNLFAGTGGAAVLRSRPGGYLLEMPESAMDAARFERCAAAGRRALDAGRFEEAVAAFQAGLGLWRGIAFAGIDLPVVRQRARTLEDRRIETVEQCLSARLGAGQHEAAAMESEALVEAHPLRERLWELLMLALYRCGRQAEALDAYQRLYRLLDEELGVRPARPVQELQQRILSGDVMPAPAPGTAGRPAEARVPRQLPASISSFVGRSDELLQLDKLLLDSDGPDFERRGAAVVVTITGMAGVGKTTLALHWAHKIAGRFTDGQLYVNLRGFDPGGRPMEPVEAMRGFLDALGVTPERIPATPEAQAGLYRTLLADKRMLVVLDNARDAEQLRPLLPGGPGCLVLVTSRNRMAQLIAFDGAHHLGLDLLTDEEARWFLEHRLGLSRVAAESEAAEAIIASCARLPLALAIAASRAAVHPRFALRALAEELREANCELDAFADSDLDMDVRAVFSWSYQTLGDDAARLFRLLALHHGPDVSAAAAASLAAATPRRTHRLLMELVRAHLISESTLGRFSLHDLVRAYAAGLAERVDTREDRDAATLRLLDHYVHTGQTANRLVYPGTPDIALPPADHGPGVHPEPLADRAAAMAWFEAEYPSISATESHVSGRFDLHVWQSAWTLHHFLSLRGRVFDLIETQSTALAAAERIGDAAAQAHSHRVLAWCSTRLGRPTDSRSHLAQALDLSTKASDLAGQAAVYRNLSHLAQHDGDSVEALGHSHRALALYRKARDRLGEARALNSIGWYHAQLGDYLQGRRFCEEALSLCLELGYTSLAANVWDSLGYIHHGLGDRDQALDCYIRARDEYRELGDRFFEADTLSHLGDLHRAEGRTEAAREAWGQALGLLTDLEYAEAAQVREKLTELDADGSSERNK
jgi:DNA-binding SARP family transcriptional activator